MRALAILMPLLALLGCAATPEDTAAADTPEKSCDAAPAQGLVGETESDVVARKAQQLSGAKTVRWLRPGQIVTMEYRADRLNLVLDGQNRISAVRCG
jgi:Peptidase inhibitor I78 family